MPERCVACVKLFPAINEEDTPGHKEVHGVYTVICPRRSIPVVVKTETLKPGMNPVKLARDEATRAFILTCSGPDYGSALLPYHHWPGGVMAIKPGSTCPCEREVRSNILTKLLPVMPLRKKN